MESPICSMCQQLKGTPLNNSDETDRNVEELLGLFEMPPGLFRGSKFCPDCLKFLALTHQVSVKIRKRKQAQEQEQGKSPAAAAAPADPGRRSSNEATTKVSLAKRMRLTQATFDGWKEKEGRSFDASSAGSVSGSDDKHDCESESVVAGQDAVVSRSDDEEYRGEGGECSNSFRSRTRSL